MADERHPTPAEETKRLYEEAETRTAKAFEQLVARDSFGELLARATENVVGVTKIATDIFDLILRNLRLAGRQDITRLARQLARNEDKLELLLQEVERLQDSLDETKDSSRNGGKRSTSRRRTGARATGSKSKS
ncbi:MAG: hypothetical protein ACJ76X_09460 [Solirubrobacteraceae bacterium]|jgi:hypothetical protein